MQLPYKRWFPAICRRRSRRLFRPDLPEERIMELMRRCCLEFRPYPGVRAVLVEKSSDLVMKGIVGNYGKVKNAPAFLAFIGDMSMPSVQEGVGYTGEGVILEATALGLDTCWVGGFFRADEAAKLTGTTGGEKVLAVSPLGLAQGNISVEEKIMTGMGRTHRRKPLEDLVLGRDQEIWPGWLKEALEAARKAPSAANRQPWRFKVETGSIIISVDSMVNAYRISKRLDCGIAMLHLEVAALQQGVQASWQRLEPPDVARFTLKQIDYQASWDLGVEIS